MTAGQRLEPLVSQTLAVADRHTAQLKQISVTVNYLQENVDRLQDAVGQLLEAGQMQSDNIQFLLREVSEQRQEVRTDLDELKHKTSGIQQTQSLTGTRIGDMENSVSFMGNQITGLDAKVTGLDAKVTGLDTKLDQLLGLLSGNK
ncbi:SIMPL domain-containing protein [Hymenobacter sp. IS2118]|uniref:SIMPL domain-containing protein n=1 Tax=Hymenobacter sp. IS2118 TaxID=1505605 RepID=UPI0005599AE0|nr:SIMPL domain-containing protein [Hymenobacter sp. IS2118]